MKKVCTICGEEKSFDDFPIARRQRGTRRPFCKECHRKANAKWRARNLETAKVCEKRWRDNNKDKASEKVRNWRNDNRAHFNANVRRYNADNREHIREWQTEWRLKNPEAERKKQEKYRDRHSGRLAARQKAREARKTQAMPAWVNPEVLVAIYEKANRLTDETGVKHHVDHIVPLTSEIVCGLHCEANLEVITARENYSKGNRWWPDMP